MHSQGVTTTATSRLPPVPRAAGDRLDLPLPPLGPLVGREAEVDALVELLAAQRLVTVTGPGGVGKSRLAWAAVERLAPTMPTLVVDLDPAAAPVRVADAVARALLGDHYAAADPLVALETALAATPMLVVLDCFDGIDRDTDDVLALLARCPRLRVLVTSMRRLAVRGERVMSLAPLPVPAPEDDPWSASSVTLLAELLADAGHPVEAADGAHLAAIARRAAGVPLALELIAGWGSVYSVRELASVQAGSLALFSGGGPDLPDRHRDLRALLSWSIDQLTDGERQVLVTIAIAPGGADRSLVAEVCGRNADADLRSLLERHLVLDGGEVHDSRVFDVLAPIRLYFTTSDDPAVHAWQQHLTEAVTARALRLAARIGAAGTAATLRELSVLDGLYERTAEQLVRADDERAVALAVALVPYWWLTARTTQGVRVLDRVAALAAGTALAAEVVVARAELSTRAAPRGALDEARHALERAGESGRTDLVQRAAVVMALALAFDERFPEALGVLDDTEAAGRDAGVPPSPAVLIAQAGYRFSSGDAGAAARTLDTVRPLLDGTVAPTVRVDAAALDLLIRLGRPGEPRGRAHTDEARALLADVEWTTIETLRLRYLASIHLLQGDHLDDAATLSEPVVDQAEATGVVAWFSAACGLRAAILALRGHVDSARRLLVRAIDAELAAADPFTSLFGDLLEFAPRLGIADDELRRLARVALKRPLPGDLASYSTTGPRGFEEAVQRAGLTAAEVAAASAERLDATSVRTELRWLRGVLEHQRTTSHTGGPVSFELSDREAEVLRHVVDGSTDREIAVELILSLRTVNTHVSNILRKTGAANRRELIARARRGLSVTLRESVVHRP